MKVFTTYQHHRGVVLSLCDYSGNWPYPWAEEGYTVLCLDLKHGDDVTKLKPLEFSKAIDQSLGMHVHVKAIFAAPLCTAFTKAAALHWKRQDEDGTTEKCVNLVNACMDLIEWFNPPVWALENPRGRIRKLCPRVGEKAFEFDPCDYAGYLPPQYWEGVTAESSVERLLASNLYTKTTAIYGRCKKPEAKRLDPIVFTDSSGKRGSVIWYKLGGKSERTKEIRSTTPMGFARAFYSANGCG